MAPSIISDPAAPEAVQPKTASSGTSKTRTTITAPLPNPSLQVTADHNLKQVEAPVYAPGHGDVLLHIKATGVCGYVSQKPKCHGQCR